MNLISVSLCLVFLFTLNVNILLVDSRELTHPLAESSRESALLKSRKRILPIRESSSAFQNHFKSNPALESDLHQDFINDRVKVALDCKQDAMRLYLNFTEPFRGVVSVGKSTHLDLTEARECSIRGQGSTKYRLDISHLNCETAFDNKCGQFTNTLFVRYHPSLETGGDYSKTLVCRYGSSFNVN